MGKTVYFDTNVFGDLSRKRSGVTAADESALRSAVRDGKISIVLSVLNFEEKLCAFNNCHDLTLAELQFIQDLIEWDKCVKEPEHLLEDDICSYTQDGEQNGPFMTDSRRVSQMRTLLNSGPEYIAQVLGSTDFLQEVEDKKRNFQVSMTAARDKALCNLHGLKASDLRFSTYWNINAKRFAQALIRSPEVLSACQARGIEGLLDIRSVRLCVGVHLSLVYAHDFEGREVLRLHDLLKQIS